jgi:predicted nucleic acid-binding protein
LSLYIDSSALVSLYYPEASSRAVARAIGNVVITFTFLHELELKNGLSLKKFRGEASDAEIRGTLRLIEEDRAAGRLSSPALEWSKCWRLACELSLRYSGDVGTRSLDVLHIAAALELGARQFLSLDERQQKMAELAGLSLVRLR